MKRNRIHVATIVLSAIFAALAAGCSPPLADAPSLTVTDRDSQEVWSALMTVIDERYPIAEVDTSGNIIVTEWVRTGRRTRETAPEGATAAEGETIDTLTLRRRAIANQSMENGASVVRIQVEVQQLRLPSELRYSSQSMHTYTHPTPGHQGRSEAPAPHHMEPIWQDAGVDDPEARRLLDAVGEELGL